MAWTKFGKKKDMPEGLWIKCESCGSMLFLKEFEAKQRVCSNCGYHFTMPARERIAMTADEGSFKEVHTKLEAEDRLKFVDNIPYKKKLKNSQKKTGEKDAMIVGTCTIKGMPVVLGVMNFAFMGGSMGMVVGEKVARAVEEATTRKLPLIVICCSGGARMHEGAISLMQMAKTCATLSKLNDAGGFSISVLTHPTTGGVTASFASVCDVLLAEPGALIGFAGPRVIATTIKKELPKGFQRAEFLLEKGQIDRIVQRRDLRRELARLVAYATGQDVAAAYRRSTDSSADLTVEAAAAAEALAAEKQATAKPKSKAKAKTKADKQADTDAKTSAKADAKTSAKTGAKTSAKAGAKTSGKTGGKTGAKAGAKTKGE
jgi:acetyl-CoA carboxylase carboxyl transferase subunit beta